MYIGSTDARGLHHLVYEVVDNSVDEALAGACDRIEVIINADDSVTVIDNGRGIPVGPHPVQKKPNGEPMDTLEVVHTILHAGGKFGGSGYKVASGLHGVGVSAVNALSKWLEVEVQRDGHIYRQRYEQGVPATPVEMVGKAKTKDTGTRTTFLADSEIFDTLNYKFESLIQRFREMAFLTRGLTLHLVDNREVRGKPLGREVSFYFEGGIAAFARYLNKNREVLHPRSMWASRSTAPWSRRPFSIPMAMPSRCLPLPTTSTQSMAAPI
jgi:DNA gyrase subunit B